MLKPEAAKQQLEQWFYTGKDEQEDAAERYLPQIAKLAKPLKAIGYALFDRDASGKEVKRDNWNERYDHWHKACTELDALAVRERTAFFELFLPNLAESAEHGWQYLKQAPYQTGYTRKPFRAPRHAEITLPGRAGWLRDLVQLAGQFRAEVVTVPLLAAWAPHIEARHGGDQDVIGRLLAAVMDAGGPLGDEVFDILAQSARNEHEVGGMGRHVTRGLLLGSRPDGWELMEKTLLAAQRQEGLRQAILETVDEAHPQAFRRMLRLIVEHDLARFSSVVRALNVWIGFAWDSVSTKTVNDTIEKLLLFLGDVDVRKRALEGKNAEDDHLALWSIAYEDAMLAIPAAGKLLKHAKVEQRYVAALFLSQLGLKQAQSVRLPALDDQDLRVAFCALAGGAWSEEAEPDELDDESQGQTGGVNDLFERLERLYKRLPPKPTVAKPLVWPWTQTRIDRQQVAAHLVGALGRRPPTSLIPYLSGLDSWQRRRAVELLTKQKKWDKLTRDTLLDLAGDPSGDVRQAAIEALSKNPLQPGESERLEVYLTRKASDLRRGAIGLLGRQKDDAALGSADRLLTGDGNQRLAGLELLRQLAEASREHQACQDRAAAYHAKRKKLSKEEQTQLAAIAEAGKEKNTLDNALGLFDPAGRTPITSPRKRDALFITDAAVACLRSLDELVHERREATVQIQIGKEVEEKLLGTLQWGFPRPAWTESLERNKAKLPLRELWEEWRDKRPKALRDRDGLELVRAFAWADVGEYEWPGWRSWAKASTAHRYLTEILSGGKEPAKLRYSGLVRDILDWLTYLDPPAKLIDSLLDSVESAFAQVPEAFLSKLTELPAEETPRYYYQPDEETEQDWRQTAPFKLWIDLLQRWFRVGTCKPPEGQWTRYWRLLHWQDEPVPGARRDRPDLAVMQEAYAAGAANEADWYDHLLGQRPKVEYDRSFADLNTLTARRASKETEAYFQRFPEVRRIVDRCRERVLEIELARGEEVTAATQPALELKTLHGTDTLLRILSSLGKQGFKVEPSWRDDRRRVGRSATLTHLVSITYPSASDTPEDFAAKLRSAVNAKQVAEERVLELAFLAPQWARFIEAYLGWAGFSEGLYWFLAHMKYVWGVTERAAVGAGIEPTEETEEGEQQGEQRSSWDRLILERTPLTDEERRAGAVDVAWFQRTYAQLTPQHWSAMASAARFSASANQARRAQFVADVLLGKASRKELISGIRTKKLKDYVRLLGLLPLASGPKRDADLAERYKVLQEYRRYAKQLSAMTKEDALRSVEVGMQNLARTAGYPDPLRLEWAMEADSVKDLARGPVSAARDGVTVTLALDEASRPLLTVRRGDKELKSIPPAIKKDKRIAALAERVVDLKRQSSRMRQSLETAMCRGDAFSGAELVQLCEHAILAPLLERLVLIGDGIVGYPDKKGKALRDQRGKLEPVKKDEMLRIAHPHDLLEQGAWDAWQNECFRAERVQPFKQVFRELYVVTKQEKADKTLSRRYAGQQVNPSQAYALWGQRGWNTKEGVWKAFHDLRLSAGVAFNYGVTTPLEVEGLTIETVSFFHWDETEAIKLTDVPPRAFSEVMRDLDLVVSVAHRGGVDPEASASTVEMRAGLLRETCQLLQLKNVRLKDSHALVDGELAKYSVHLGSATVHKLPGGALCIVPVHAQHRGRLFLPFADDDPKTAEVVSKVLLLARDREIHDPTILDQLRR